MKSDFLLAITQLSAEKNLPTEVVIAAVEAALVSAYRKESFAPNQNISVKINPTTGRVKVWAEKKVVEQPADSRCEISPDEARQIKPEVQIGEVVTVEATPPNAGRIAAQTAKQVILQRLHEAEHNAILEEYAGRESDIVAGVVQHLEPKQIFIDLGRAEAVLPAVEQVPTERYRIGQRLKVYLLEVTGTGKGPRMVVSRSHPGLLRRLFETEVPEVFHGAVEIKAVAREAGFRSKVAVAARQAGVDPVGCCVGLRGIRIQNIVNELNGEKIDVIQWDPDVPKFIASALSPAQVVAVKLDKGGEAARVVVPDRHLSLAIGKEGQNVRLAVKLTGWRIDVKSASAAEAERVEAEKAEAARAEAVRAEAEEAAVEEELPVETPAIPELASVSAEAPERSTESLSPVEAPSISLPLSLEPKVPLKKPGLRFAEDILAPAPPKPEAKVRKKKKKGTYGRGRDEDSLRPRKVLSERGAILDEDEEY